MDKLTVKKIVEINLEKGKQPPHINKKTTHENIDDFKKGTKSKLFAGYGKNRGDDETPSSSGEKLRTTHGNYDNKNSENEEDESDENEKRNNKNKDLDTSNEESEIESGIRDDGSAMS